MSVLPVVAVVGRPNVGKSTLVNRILGRREAIVEERPGVTRDRILYTAEWRGRPFHLVDTGGLESDPEGELAGKVADVARAAASEADVIAFVVDAVAGITPEDRAVADVVRRLDARVVLVANKADSPEREQAATEFYRLGLGEPVAISALHGRATGDFLDILTEGFGEGEAERSAEPQIAIVGRPNVGKSTLFNRISGAERSIVHDEPGTTRDAVDTIVELDGRTYRFVDTAGLRRAAKVDESTEFFGSVRTMRAIERCDVAILVVDAAQGISRQDQRLAEEISELGRSAIVVLNKIDKLDAEGRAEARETLARKLPHLRWASVFSISALNGKNVHKLLAQLEPVLASRDTRVPTPLLNAILEDLQGRNPIPTSGRGVRVKYAVQVEVAPPTILLFGPNRIPDTWLRYLEKGLRQRFGFEGTPIRFVTRGRERRQSRGSSRRGTKAG